MEHEVVRCISCAGYGWIEDDLFGAPASECDWCQGIGYVYRLSDGTDMPIASADYGKLADRLEQLEMERLRELGYQGQAKRPWEQDIRRGTQGGENPYERPKSQTE